jgi:hypothetical protein
LSSRIASAETSADSIPTPTGGWLKPRKISRKLPIEAASWPMCGLVNGEFEWVTTAFAKLSRAPESSSTVSVTAGISIEIKRVSKNVLKI